MTSQNTVRIAGCVIGDSALPPPVIAEIGINHNGSVDIAEDLICRAAEVGCWAVKLQTRTVPVVYTAEELAAPRKIADKELLRRAIARGVLSPEAVARLEASNFEDTTNGDLKHALEFTDSELARLMAIAHHRSIALFSSPWDEASVDRLEALDVPCYKVASASVTDHGLLQRIKATGKPVILSTGMSTLDQVRAAVEILDRSKLVLMHTTSVYPCDSKLLNFDVIETLRREFPGIPVGYSGHEGGTRLSLMAAARYDLALIERHVTLDRKMFGSDQAASLEMGEVDELVRGLRDFYMSARGSSTKVILDEEVPVMKKLRRFP